MHRLLGYLSGNHWCSGLHSSVGALVSINEVNLRWARLILGWVTRWPCLGSVPGVWDLPPRSTQPGHPFMERHSEYQPKGDSALRLGGQRQVWFVCWWRVKLCDPLVTHGPCLSTLEMGHYKMLCKSTLLCFTKFTLTTYISIFIHHNGSKKT